MHNITNTSIPVNHLQAYNDIQNEPIDNVHNKRLKIDTESERIEKLYNFLEENLRLKVCSDREIKAVKEIIKDKQNFATNLKNIKALNLTGCQFEQVPEEIGLLENLIELRFGACGLTSLPDTFTNFKRLQVLDLRGNLFVETPKVLLEIPNLCILYMSNNHLLKRVSLGLQYKIKDQVPRSVRWI